MHIAAPLSYSRQSCTAARSGNREAGRAARRTLGFRAEYSASHGTRGPTRECQRGYLSAGPTFFRVCTSCTPPEVLWGRPAAPQMAAVADAQGQTIFFRPLSAFLEHPGSFWSFLAATATLHSAIAESDCTGSFRHQNLGQHRFSKFPFSADDGSGSAVFPYSAVAILCASLFAIGPKFDLRWFLRKHRVHRFHFDCESDRVLPANATPKNTARDDRYIN